MVTVWFSVYLSFMEQLEEIHTAAAQQKPEAQNKSVEIMNWVHGFTLRPSRSEDDSRQPISPRTRKKPNEFHGPPRHDGGRKGGETEGENRQDPSWRQFVATGTAC